MHTYTSVELTRILLSAAVVGAGVVLLLLGTVAKDHRGWSLVLAAWALVALAAGLWYLAE